MLSNKYEIKIIHGITGIFYNVVEYKGKYLITTKILSTHSKLEDAKASLKKYRLLQKEVDMINNGE